MKAAIVPPGQTICGHCGIEFPKLSAYRHTWLVDDYCSRQCVELDAKLRDAMPPESPSPQKAGEGSR